MINPDLCNRAPVSKQDGIKRKPRNMKRKLVLGAMGPTKAGKTSFIASLAKNLSVLFPVFMGDKNRTKVTVDYHIVTDLNPEEQDLSIEDIEFRLAAIAKSGDFSNPDKYNKAVATNPIYKILQLRPVENGNFEEQLKVMLNDFVQGLTAKDLARILNTEGIDDFIKKITILVEATPEFASILDESGIDLYMRDSRGLMDLALEDDVNGTKITSIRSLSDLGLDGLNGVLFFCAQDYPNIIMDIYKDTLQNVFKSVPIFLIRRNAVLPVACEIQKTPRTVSDTLNFIREIQDGKNEFFSNFELKNFQTTLKLLSNLNITEEVQGKFVFRDLYFEQSRMEFLVPESTTLTSVGTTKENYSNVSASEDYQLFRMFSVTTAGCILKMITELYSLMSEVTRGGLISNYLVANKQQLINDVADDFVYYNCTRGSTSIVRPQLESESRLSISTSLVDPKYQLLGPRGGITTVRNGNLRYAATAVLAISARRGIDSLITEISSSSGITIPAISSNIPQVKQVALIKKALYHILYAKFTDMGATVRNYNIVPRYSAERAINKNRGNGGVAKTALETSVGYALDEFCQKLNSDDVISLFTN